MPPLVFQPISNTDSSQVNERSIMSLKKRALRRSKTITAGASGDAETLGTRPTRPGRLSGLISKVRAPFTRVFWEDLLESSDDEILVDSKLLSYAYLEAGMIEAIGTHVFLSDIFCVVEFDRELLASLPTLSCSTRTDSRPESCKWRRKHKVGILIIHLTIDTMLKFSSSLLYKIEPRFRQ